MALGWVCCPVFVVQFVSVVPSCFLCSFVLLFPLSFLFFFIIIKCTVNSEVVKVREGMDGGEVRERVGVSGKVWITER